MKIKKLVTCFISSVVVICGLGINSSVYCQAEDNMYDIGTPYDYEDSEGNTCKIWITDSGDLSFVVDIAEGTVLKELIIPDTVKRGGWEGINYARAEKIYIPATVENMIFVWNEANEFIVDENNPFYCSVDGIVYSKDMKTLYGYPKYREDKIFKVPDGVEVMKNEWIMSEPSDLEYVIFSSTVKEYKGDISIRNNMKFYIPSEFNAIRDDYWDFYIERYNYYIKDEINSGEPKIVYTETDSPYMEIFNSNSSWLPVTGSDNYNLRHFTTALKMSLGIYDTQIDLWKYEHTGKESLLFDEDENSKVDMQDVVVVLNKVLGIE